MNDISRLKKILLLNIGCMMLNSNNEKSMIMWNNNFTDH